MPPPSSGAAGPATHDDARRAARRPARLGGLLTGRRGAWLVLLLAVLGSATVITFGGTARTSADPTSALPDTAESVQVAQLRRQLPNGQQNPALVVYSRAGRPLTADDERAIAAQAAAFADDAVGGQVSPPVYAPDRAAALLAVPLPADLRTTDLADRVDRLRATARDGLPTGLTAQVTGGAGFSADVASAFDGANVTLLLVTVSVVALLLIITYRSPWLWLVPLAVVGTADVVANAVIAPVSRATGLDIDPSTTGIVDVLVFGAGTNYALLLIARYREELRRLADRRDALRRALGSAGPAIAASAATVCLSLLTLLAADLGNARAIGVAGAVGIAVAALFGLLVLPAALSVCGRGLFWPFVPRPGQADPTRTGGWARVGRAVDRRPTAVLAGSLLLLALLAAGLFDARLGLSRTEQFRVQAESIDGLATVSRHFPAGYTDPTVVIAPADARQATLDTAAATPGVSGARVTGQGAGLVAIDVVLDAEPDSAASYRTIRELRERLDEVPAPGGAAAGDRVTEPLVGGTVATNLDTREAAVRDLRVVVPLILAVVLLVLIVLLRALVAALILVATVVATFFAALGASTLLFTRVLDYAALDTSVPLLAFLFLVALGVDYNIFLATRAREEAITAGTRRGVLTALAVTGGVITSAGILLAAVFAVLGVLPLVTLTEIGVIVGFGVLLDTLLVRTLLVPSVAITLGRRFWWPGRLSRPADQPRSDRPSRRDHQAGRTNPAAPGPGSPTRP